MLAIKLKRIGKKHQAAFRVVVAEKRSKLGGKDTEDLGFANPRTNTHKIDVERVRYWMEHGAQPTPTVHNLLIKEGVLTGEKIPVHAKKKAADEKK